MIKGGVLDVVYQTSANGLPFYVGVNEKKFKLLFMDIGLAKHAMHLDVQTLLSEDLSLINQGALAEQFVGQELLAYSDRYEDFQLFYWAREKTGSMAEVDYVINYGSQIIPIEVKAGKVGRLRSMRVFLEEKNLSVGVQISQKTLQFERGVLSVPFYMIFELPRLLSEISM